MIRPMTVDDVPSAIRLSSAAGWNQTAADWLRVFAFQPDGCFAAEVDAELVGTVTCTCYADKLAWIGMMLVAETQRRRGIGEQLMRRVLRFLEDKQVSSVKLDATPLGEPLYRRLGFQPEWAFHRWRREGNPSRKEPPRKKAVDQIAGDQVAQANCQVDGNVAWTQAARQRFRSLDLEAFGVDRQAWLAAVARDSRVQLNVDAFAMLRSGRIAAYLGPVVGADDRAAAEVIETLVGNCPWPIFWDIPGRNQAAPRLARTLGFTPVRDLLRMEWKGASSRDQPSRQPELARQYGIAGPAVG